MPISHVFAHMSDHAELPLTAKSDPSNAACKKRIGSFYLAVNRNKSKENLPLNYEGDFR